MPHYYPNLLFTAAGLAAFANIAVAEEIDFNRDVLPVLSNNCFKCHGPDAAHREADLRLDTREGALADLGHGYHAIVPGDPDASEIIYRMETDDTEDLMPPPKSNLSLTKEEIAILRQWIAEGAEWKNHWSFEPVQRPKLPKTSNPDWSRNGIDPFILKRLETEGLAPSPEADKTTLIRRLTLDLTGLPPTPQEIETFLEDPSPDAYEKLVDRLLASPRFGETMALPWLEAARYADTDGYQNDGPRTMWRWRDWVINAYNQNLPFDQFTIEQLAGDLLPNPTLDQRIATGFNRNHRYNSESGLVLEEFLLENAVDRVDTTSTVWMGLTMACARCHDHKYDPFSTKEYYQLVSLFDNVPESGRAVKFGNSEPWISSPTDAQADQLAQKDQAIQTAEAQLKQAAKTIRKALGNWETENTAPLDESTFLTRDLINHYPLEDASKQVSEKTQSPVFAKGIRKQAFASDGESLLVLKSEARLLCQTRFTLSFWIHPDSPKDSVILSNQAPGTTRPGITAELKDGRLQFYIISRWIAGVGAIETLEAIQANRWTHITLTNDGSQSATGMRILVNGDVAKTRILHNTNSNTMARKENTLLRIGGGLVGKPFQGKIDDLRIYHRTLEADEAKLLAEPATLSAIAERSRRKRTPSQSAKLTAYFLQNAASEDLRALDQTRYQAKLDRTAYFDKIPTTMIMQEMDPPRPTHVRTRGVYHDYGDIVSENLPEVLPDYPKGSPKNRLGFAQWLVSGEHPLTGRVAVNRYWIKYFGRGIVKTAEDFGLQGDWPSHPELLDWLADEFVRLDWDIKAMQKLIVTSAAYRQQSRVTPELLAKDPENILISRGPRQRLSAHAARDQALALSGLLAERVGGPSVSPYQPDKLWETMSNMKYKQSSGDDLYRRSLYTIWKRTVPPPTMALLDAADRESCIVSAKRTNTPLQALVMLNEKLFVEAARNFGQRILAEGGDTLSSQVHFAFLNATGRSPKAKEKQILESAYRDYIETFQASPQEAEKLIAIGESQAAPTVDPTRLAAAATLANVLLNLDEVITKE